MPKALKAQKYMLQTQGFYRLGKFYKPGEPFEIAEGTYPPLKAVSYPDGEPVWTPEMWEQYLADRAADKETRKKLSSSPVTASPLFVKPEAVEQVEDPSTMSEKGKAKPKQSKDKLD